MMTSWTPAALRWLVIFTCAGAQSNGPGSSARKADSRHLGSEAGNENANSPGKLPGEFSVVQPIRRTDTTNEAHWPAGLI